MKLTGIKDLDYDILNRLSDRELVNFCEVDTSAYNICSDDKYWLSRLQAKYPQIPVNYLYIGKGDKSWNQYYISLYKGKITPENAKEKIRFAARANRPDIMVLASEMHNDFETYRLAFSDVLKYGYPELIEYLVKYVVTNYPTKIFGLSEMANLLAENKNTDLVKYMVENVENLDLNFILVAATKPKANLDMIKYLMDNGANINYFNGWPLKTAITFSDIDTVKYLVNNGADPKLFYNYYVNYGDKAQDYIRDPEILDYIRSLFN